MSGSCCETTGATTLEEVRVAGVPALTRIHVALAGQPNVGKSTIFNVLTGLNQHVGNWPGKTVEQKIGSYHAGRCHAGYRRSAGHLQPHCQLS